jgi:hypothetical protein
MTKPLIQNYRVNITGKAFDLDYWKEFKKTHKWYPKLARVYDYAESLGIKVWWFFEPWIEINWTCDNRATSVKLIKFIKKEFPKFKKEVLYPKDGQFADWFCNNDKEREFGVGKHEASTYWVRQYIKYKDGVDKGKGLEQQVKRTIHTLCNPLGLTYIDEAKICFSHALGCVLYKWCGPKVGRFIYKKIFRCKY